MPDDVARALNLFRGQVGMPLELVSLSGRNGLDVGIAPMYSSAVRQQVETRNRDAPTSVLGVGWAMDYERIVVGDRSVGLREQQRFFLVDQTGTQALYRVESSDGVLTFQMREYQFWKIELLDPEDARESRWRVTREDGSTRLYGGSGAVQWGASWDGWVGPSTAGGAEAFPATWNLAEVHSAEGDRIVYGYETDEVEIGGVGVSRAARLAKVTDVFGRSVEFSYKEKELFEKEFPQVPPPGASPAYQFSFETRFLDSITVRERTGEVNFRQSLGYELLDVLAPRGEARPEFTKRYLTEVRQEAPEGPELPALHLRYETDPEAPAPGALKAQTFVTGAGVTYRYDRASVEHSSCALEVDGPSDHRPQVSHGAEFTVVTWYAEAAGRLEVWVCTWSGSWRVWRDDSLAQNDVADVSVHVGQSFFAVRYRDVSHDLSAVRLYHEDPHRSGAWETMDLRLGPELEELRMAFGPDFVALQGRGSASMRIVRWDALRKRWDEQDLRTPGSEEVALGGADGFVLGAYHTPGSNQLRLQMFYTDTDGMWQTGPSADVTQAIDWRLTRPESVWAIGSALGAATFITGIDSGMVSSTVVLLRWGAAYALRDVEAVEVTQPVESHNPILYSVLADSVVGHAADAVRLDAGVWSHVRLLDPEPQVEYRYAYGSDLALAARLNGGIQRFSAQRYDPYEAQWTQDGAPAPSELTGADGLFAPAAVGDYAQLGRKVFTRSPQSEWIPIYDVPESVVGPSCALSSGGYLAYERQDDPSTEVVFMEDGMVVDELLRLPGERCYVPDAGPGEVLAGPTTLVTYRGEDFRSARTLTLHRVLGRRMPDHPTTSVVVGADVDDGFATRSLAVDYEDDGAAFDPAGSTVQFTRARVRWTSDPERGSTLHTFYNGLEPDDRGAFYPPDGPWSNVRQYLSLVSGQIWKSETFSKEGELASRVATTFWVYDRADGPPGSVPAASLAEQGTSNLAGVYMRARRSDRTLVLPASEAPGTQVEITGVETYEYNPYGQESCRTAFNVAPDGTEERYETRTTYGWEVYKGLRDAHILNPIAQVERRNPRTGRVVGIEVTTHADRWPSAGARTLWGERDFYAWRGVAGTTPFDYAEWSGQDEPPPGWLLTQRVVDRSPGGVALEQRDVDGVSMSRVLDRDGHFLVAELDATSRIAGEGWYWGFETYEDPGPWQVAASATIEEGAAYAGRRALRVPGANPGEAALTGTFRSTGESTAFMLSCRARTPRGSGTAPFEAVWRVLAGGVSREFLGSATDGRWRLWSVPLHPGAFGLQRFEEIRVELVNPSHGLTLLIDALFCNPLIGAAAASVYSQPHGLQVAKVGRLGPYSATLFDGLRRPVVEIGSDGMPATFSAEFTRSEGGSGPPEPAFDLEVQARVTGSYLCVAQGDACLDEWSVIGAWGADGDGLRHTGVEEGRLLTRWVRSEPLFVVRASLEPRGPRPAQYGLDLGGTRLTYLGGRWVLIAPGGRELASTSASVPPERDLFAVVSDSGVLVLGDGRPLIRAPVGAQPHGLLGAFATGDALVSNLVAADGVSPRATFRNRMMRPVQEQIQRANGVVARVNLLDGGGRPAVTTRPVFDKGGILGFAEGLVTSFDWSTGALTGTIADCYPEDDGYPYTRVRYDSTPLARVVETGLPGWRLAIDERVPAPDRRTQRTLYESATPHSGPLALPAGGFSVTGSVDQDGLRWRRAADRLGRPVREVRDNAHDGSIRPEIRSWEYDDAGRLAVLRLPNAFDTSRPDADGFRQLFVYDFLGRLVERDVPDSEAPAQSVYDAAGRVRFSVDAAGLTTGSFVYQRYDRLGRLLEDGVCHGPWDRAILEAHAEDRDWLPASAQALNVREYDGTGADPYGVGRLVSAVARPTEGEGPTVTETFKYDVDGRIVERTQTVQPGGAGTDRVSVSYDLLGNETEETHRGPDGQSFTVHLVQDEESRLVRIQGRGAGPAEALAAYEYTVEGQVAKETLGPDAPAPLERNYTYGSAGWLAAVRDASFVQEIKRDDSYAGRVTGTSERFIDPPAIPGFVDRFDTSVRRDGHGRLMCVSNSAGEQYDLGTVNPLAYDSNGNLLALSRGSEVQRHVFAPGTNQLVEVDGVGEYVYDATGALRRASPLRIDAIERHPTSGQPVRVRLNGGTHVDFGYTAGGRRVLEANGSTTALAVHNPRGRLLARRVRVGDSWQTMWYVHGPTGLAAARTADRRLFLLRDHVGSIRGVYDGSHLVAAASYQPMGDPLGARWIDSGLARLLPQGFTGQQHGPPDGLILFPARLYDPFVGRFDRVDPVDRHPSPYAYAAGDPLNFIDPSGEDSLGALLGMVVGAALIVGGVAAIFFSSGAATPAVATAWSVGGSFLLGAGIASGGYGVGQKTEGSEFSAGEWLGLTGLGGLFGAISGYASIGAQTAVTAATAFQMEVALGVVTGASDGFISNGVVNVSNGRSFDDRWYEGLLTGAGGGAGGGAIGGFFGRRVALQNVRALRAMGQRRVTVTAHRINSRHLISHSVVSLQRGRTLSAFEQVITEGDGGFVDLAFGARRVDGWRRPLTEFARFDDFDPGRGIRGSVRVNAAAGNKAGQFAEHTIGPTGSYSFISNSCTTQAIDVINAAGLTAPPWAYSPTTLVVWMRGLPHE